MTGRELEDDDGDRDPIRGEVLAALLLMAIVAMLAWVTWLAFHAY